MGTSSSSRFGAFRRQCLIVCLITCLAAACESKDAEPPAPPAGSPEPHIDHELSEHTKVFEKKIYKIGDNVWSAVGYQIANTILVEGPEGVILFDVGGAPSEGREIAAEFAKITSKPVVAVVYSHFHPDHWTAVKAYVSEEQVREGKVQVWAHESLVRHVANQGVRIGPVLAVRSGYSFGAMLPPADMEGMNSGLGPRPGFDPRTAEAATFIAPTHTVGDRVQTRLAGLDVVLVHVPSEAPDEIAMWLPQSRILLSAEVIQGPTFPNVHTLRGTSFRDPVAWFESIDLLRSFDAEHMVPSHGPPVMGAGEVERVLQVYRDGIQYVHDQTIRRMNEGMTPEELAETIKLPQHLAEVKPWLREYYGTVKHSVRQIYQGYLGWFDGDPVGLNPTARIERSRRYVAMMGGRDKVFEAARDAENKGDAQWSAELCTHLVRTDHGDRQARELKARAFRRLGYDQRNINWRNWYLTAAMELEETLDGEEMARLVSSALASRDVVAALPTRTFLEGMTARLKAEDALDTHLTAGFRFTDAQESFALEVRRGVAQLHDGIPEHADVVLALPRTLLERIAIGEIGVVGTVTSGEISVEKGGVLDAGRFFSLFETPSHRAIPLVVR
ncbi:MAG TPA: alkyl sulfatase dimerization domain-containing protein [Candidatus Binatia bacterium]|nr:alkyl sulfatase dimerization domain-containing protein [Candidatus Binatia bacterium]